MSDQAANFMDGLNGAGVSVPGTKEGVSDSNKVEKRVFQKKDKCVH